MILIVYVTLDVKFIDDWLMILIVDIDYSIDSVITMIALFVKLIGQLIDN